MVFVEEWWTSLNDVQHVSLGDPMFETHMIQVGLGLKRSLQLYLATPKKRIEQQFMIIYDYVGFYSSSFVGGYYTYDAFFWNPSQI